MCQWFVLLVCNGSKRKFLSVSFLCDADVMPRCVLVILDRLACFYSPSGVFQMRRWSDK